MEGGGGGGGREKESGELQSKGRERWTGKRNGVRDQSETLEEAHFERQNEKKDWKENETVQGGGGREWADSEEKRGSGLSVDQAHGLIFPCCFVAG